MIAELEKTNLSHQQQQQKIFGQMKTILTSTRMMGLEKYGEGKEQPMIRLWHHLSNMVVGMLWPWCMWLPVELVHECSLMM